MTVERIMVEDWKLPKISSRRVPRQLDKDEATRLTIFNGLLTMNCVNNGQLLEFVTPVDIMYILLFN